MPEPDGPVTAVKLAGSNDASTSATSVVGCGPGRMRVSCAGLERGAHAAPRMMVSGSARAALRAGSQAAATAERSAMTLAEANREASA